MMDPLVPLNLVNQCRLLYLSSNCQADEDKDPFISPLIAATDEVLAKFPPTSFVVGSFDPFFDDCNIIFAYDAPQKGRRQIPLPPPNKKPFFPVMEAFLDRVKIRQSGIFKRYLGKCTENTVLYF